MRALLLSLSICVLAACQPGEKAPPEAADSADRSSSIIASPETLAGEYRVAGIDGADVNLPHGISASITNERIDIQSDCIRFAWTYRFEGQSLVTEQAPVASCRRALLPEERALAEAMEAADAVRRTPANGIEFSGGGRSVTLFGQ
jgi:hypothetical protein